MSEKFDNKIIIVGAGFSAVFAKLLSKNYTKIIGCLNAYTLGLNKIFFKRKNIASNKFFSKKISSYGSLKLKLNNSFFHDRLVAGGNSSIWGGHINIEKIPKLFLTFLSNKGIEFKKLNYEGTGTISNIKKIRQIQFQKNKILDSNEIGLNIKNVFINDFFVNKKKIFIRVKTTNKKKFITIKVKKLFLCIGTVQLLDLLYRSKFLKDRDIFEFSEFENTFKLNFSFCDFKKKSNVIRYNISRAIGHFLGIQFYSKVLKLLSFLPISVDQNISFKKNKSSLILNVNTLNEHFNKNKNYQKFGKSVHYCDLKINGKNINNFLNSIDKNILGFGMPFVRQKKPGPISNDILIDIIKKLKILKLLRDNEN